MQLIPMNLKGLMLVYVYVRLCRGHGGRGLPEGSAIFAPLTLRFPERGRINPGLKTRMTKTI